VPYEPLAWDSEFFGFPVGRVADEDGDLAGSVRTADAEGVRCLYLLCGGGDRVALTAAADLGFRLYDARVELDRRLDPDSAPSSSAHEARPEEAASLEQIARRRMRGTRFWNDPHFDRERVADLYAAWLQRGLDTAPRRRTLVVGEAEGFIVCGFDASAGVGSIELIAVAEGSAGRGLGRELVAAADGAFATAGMTKAIVVTQGQNLAAQRLYQRCGYRSSRFDLWLHRWASGL
jgi:dTDP-4-amino-4,6-dideoxy-D-galactose acyltransferase